MMAPLMMYRLEESTANIFLPKAVLFQMNRLISPIIYGQLTLPTFVNNIPFCENVVKYFLLSFTKIVHNALFPFRLSLSLPKKLGKDYRFGYLPVFPGGTACFSAAAGL